MKYVRRHRKAPRALARLVAVTFAFSTMWAHAVCICSTGIVCSSGVSEAAPACTCSGHGADDENAPRSEAAHGSCCAVEAVPAQEAKPTSCCSSHHAVGDSESVGTIGAQPCSCALSSDTGAPAFPGREQPQLQPGKRLNEDLPLIDLAIQPLALAWPVSGAALYAADSSPPARVPTAALLCTFRC